MWNKASGFLVVSESIIIKGMAYHGVDTDAWPLGTNFTSNVATSILENSYLNLALPVLVDFDSAFHYCLLCKQAGVKPRMLFCEAIMDHSVNSIPSFASPPNMTCLGFDYAYPSGDYYSAIVNDIICRNGILPTPWRNHLNEFGLLPTMDELMRFVEERALAAEESEQHGHGMLFEKGDFVCFRVFLVDYNKEYVN